MNDSPYCLGLSRGLEPNCDLINILLVCSSTAVEECCSKCCWEKVVQLHLSKKGKSLLGLREENIKVTTDCHSIAGEI